MCSATWDPFGGISTAAGAPRRLRLDAAEQALEAVMEAVSDPSRHSHHHALGPVPRVEVGGERLAGRALDRVLRPEDVPPERLIAVEEPVVHAADVARRRVEVDVHLLEDHALLLLDLGRVEA